ncbi:Phytoene [Hortaea werneckii]|nr:Phytoene [Hortaea werneckii]KAI7108812.1 Phytoene [Hortaea werneckii]KAI7331697.1 Phytoene [Hortaea werneckii]KAI7391911.1 Phytoene [Hortaea werneckii]
MPDPKPRRPTAIVIGAGVGGTSTAARLAHAGYSVTVLEKNPFTGGRCSLLYSGADQQYRFDQGPSLLLLPRLFHQTFHDLDTSLAAEGVELRKCDPNYRIHFGDGTNFELSSDLAAMKTEVEKWEGNEGFERYLDFLRESGRHYELSVEHVLLKNFESLAGMLRWSFLKHLLTLHPFESIWTRAGKFFWTERLRRVFTFGSMYMGMSPFDAPGTYSLLQYTELAEGIWYPVGGFHRVVQALVEVGERKGVEYRLGTAVKRIVLSEDGGKVVGVETEKGELLTADVVVNNSDLVYAYTNLLGESSSTEGEGGKTSRASQPAAPPTPYAKSLANRPASCSSISFYWGLSRTVPELGAHNIFLADEYRESFDSIFKRHLIPDEPSFYVNVPSRVDPSAAPEGTDSVVVLVPVGHLIDVPSGEGDTGATPNNSNSNTTPNATPQSTTDIQQASPATQPGLQPSTSQDWPAMIALARRTILTTIHDRTGVDLAPLIQHESTNDPLTWKQKFNLDRGAILGLSHSFFNVLSFRPSTRARRPSPVFDGHFGAGVLGRLLELLADLVRGKAGCIEGLYMVGASAHPGTGVPICLAGGKMVAEQVLDDRGMVVPWRCKGMGKGEGRKEVKGLDKVDRPWWLDSWGQWMGIWGFLVVVLWSWVVFGVFW